MSTEGEVILQVKVRRGDVYDAVRNILLNEFKVLPHDLLAAVDKKLENKLQDAVHQAVYRSYGFSSKLDYAITRIVNEAKAGLETKIAKLFEEEVRAEADRIIKKVLSDKLGAAVREGK